RSWSMMFAKIRVIWPARSKQTQRSLFQFLFTGGWLENSTSTVTSPPPSHQNTRNWSSTVRNWWVRNWKTPSDEASCGRSDHKGKQVAGVPAHAASDNASEMGISRGKN